MTTSAPSVSHGYAKQKKPTRSRSHLFKMTKSAPKTKRQGKAAQAANRKRKALRASRNAAREEASWNSALESSGSTIDSIQVHVPHSDSDFKDLMAWIYTELHNESLDPSNPAGDLADVRRWAPELVVECLAKFAVNESAVAHLSAPNDPLSSEVITTVASEFVALSNRIKTERLFSFKELTCKRYGEFAIRENLMLLSILSHSATFREAAETWDEANWSTLVEYIGGNAVSIGAFARVRGLNYKTSLKRVADYIPLHLKFGSLSLSDPRYEVSLGEHHSWVNSEENGVKPPSFDGYPQINIDNNIYDERCFQYTDRPRYWPENTPYPSDPTIRPPGEGTCVCCGSTNICACDPLTHPAMAGPLLELHDYGGVKGTGIRALQYIYKGAILAEYVGELRPALYRSDPVYGFEITPLGGKTHEAIAMISAKKVGNWTRFINHSCRASTTFEQVVVGDRVRIMVVVCREIGWGEKVTVNYGGVYWNEGRRCICGEEGCCSRKWEEEKEEGEAWKKEEADKFLEELEGTLGIGECGDVADDEGGSEHMDIEEDESS